MKLLAAIPLVILLSPVGSEHAGAAGSAPADAIIRGGIVIDGSGAKGRRADVVIAGGRIVRVGNAAGFESVQVIEARGLAVAPGFIDVHTHADRLADQPLAENYIRRDGKVTGARPGQILRQLPRRKGVARPVTK